MKRFVLFCAIVASLAMLTMGCSGGGGGGGAAATGSAQSSKMFVTSTTYDGNLGGLAGADAICQAQATAAGLSGTYAAWLSDSTTDAYCHVQGLTGTVATNCNGLANPTQTGPWVRTDGNPFADTLDKLVLGQVLTPPRYTENGALVTPGGSATIFTATRRSGALNTPYTSCSDWTSNSGLYVAGGGTSSETTRYWTDNVAPGCDTLNHLVCLQTGPGIALPSRTIPAGAKRVFVTSNTHQGNLGGLSGADGICQTAATDAGLSGTFVAWLSDDTHDAGDRVTSIGPWYRLDSIKVADDKTDLLDGSLFTSINCTAAGEYVNLDGGPAWTGTYTNGTNITNYNCGNWGSSDSGDSGRWGNTGVAGSSWTYANAAACNGARRIYCFEN